MLRINAAPQTVPTLRSAVVKLALDSTPRLRPFTIHCELAAVTARQFGAVIGDDDAVVVGRAALMRIEKRDGTIDRFFLAPVGARLHTCDCDRGRGKTAAAYKPRPCALIRRFSSRRRTERNARQSARSNVKATNVFPASPRTADTGVFKPAPDQVFAEEVPEVRSVREVVCRTHAAVHDSGSRAQDDEGIAGDARGLEHQSWTSPTRLTAS